jgi:uncharacterized membrane protein
MGSEPAALDLLVAAWPRPASAERALHTLRATRPAGMVGIVDAATVVLDVEGALRITDTRDLGAGRGAAVGGVVGAGLGLLTTGIGWLRIGGAAFGALAVRARDGGLRADRIRLLGETIRPTSSVLVAAVEAPEADDVARQLASERGDLVREPVGPDLVRRLDIGTWSVFSSADTSGDVLAVRSTAPVMRALDSVPAGMA